MVTQNQGDGANGLVRVGHTKSTPKGRSEMLIKSHSERVGQRKEKVQTIQRFLQQDAYSDLRTLQSVIGAKIDLRLINCSSKWPR
jgi:hypothetical protein